MVVWVQFDQWVGRSVEMECKIYNLFSLKTRKTTYDWGLSTNLYKKKAAISWLWFSWPRNTRKVKNEIQKHSHKNGIMMSFHLPSHSSFSLYCSSISERFASDLCEYLKLWNEAKVATVFLQCKVDTGHLDSVAINFTWLLFLWTPFFF